MSETMIAVVQEKYGGPEVLQLKKDAPIPSITPSQVLVKMHAAGVNSADSFLRSGKFAFPFFGTKLPLTVGAEGSGVVTAVGDKVTKFKVGDAIFGATVPSTAGAYGQYCTFEEKNIAIKPDNVPFTGAATISTSLLTAHKALVTVGKVKAGQRMLVIGASGGVGSHVVHLGKYYGLYVIGVCSGKNAKFVKEQAGADLVIDYTTQKISDVLTRPEDKVDIVVDAVNNFSGASNNYLNEGHSVLKPGGQFVSVTSLNYARYYGGMLRLCNPITPLGPAWPNGTLLQELTELYAQNKLRPLVTEVVKFEDVQAIHTRLDACRACGKIVFEIPQ